MRGARRSLVWALVAAVAGCGSSGEGNPDLFMPMLDDAGKIIVPKGGSGGGGGGSGGGSPGADASGDALAGDGRQDTTTADASAPGDLAAPDAPAPDATTDLAAPDASVPDAPAADAPAPDAAEPDGTTADAPAPDDVAAQPDVAAVDLAPPPDVTPDAPGADMLDLARSKATIYAQTGDSVTFTATGHRNKKLTGAGVSITFTTTRGVFVDGNGASLGNEVTVDTGADSKATVKLVVPDAGAGVAMVSATCPGASAMSMVNVIAVQQITHMGTTCGGATCAVMGIKGSGFNEQARITFKVVDSTAAPVPGATVDFMLVTPPPGTTVATASEVTDDLGQVVATVVSGPLIGAFTLRASVRGTNVETTSPAVGVRGAKPANRGFSLQCSPINVNALASALPPTPIDVTCNVKLVDRFGNPIGTGASVYLRSEAGAVPFAVATKAYNPAGPNPEEGTVTFTFSTVGVFPPLDVAPLVAAGGQWPRPRLNEPTRMDGALVRNPRDGLVTILAYIRGEEFFQDDNANGTRDGSEMFVDQGEPFVDANDSGVWESGEPYVDEAPADSKWNPPNGTWDTSTVIWTETRLLYSGFGGSGASAGFRFAPTTFGPVPVGGSVVLNVYASDPNGNIPWAQTAFSYTLNGMRGTLSATQPTKVQDGFGFDLERRLVSASDATDCTAATPVCLWRVLFYSWSDGYIGDVRVLGAAMSSMMPPASVTVEGKMIGAGPEIGASASGTVE